MRSSERAERDSDSDSEMDMWSFGGEKEAKQGFEQSFWVVRV